MSKRHAFPRLAAPPQPQGHQVFVSWVPKNRESLVFALPQGSVCCGEAMVVVVMVGVKETAYDEGNALWRDFIRNDSLRG